MNKRAGSFNSLHASRDTANGMVIPFICVTSSVQNRVLENNSLLTRYLRSFGGCHSWPVTGRGFRFDGNLVSRARMERPKH